MRRVLSLIWFAAFVDPVVGASARGWKTIQQENGIRVEVHPADSQTMVRGTALVLFAEKDVKEVLLDLAGFARWFPGLSAWTVIEREDESALVHGRHALPWPFQDRDYVVRYTWGTEATGAFVLESRAVANEGLPRRDGAVRLLRARSTWKLEAKSPTETLVQYTYNGDTGGSFPDLLRTVLWKSEVPKIFAALHKEIEQRRDEQ